MEKCHIHGQGQCHVHVHCLWKEVNQHIKEMGVVYDYVQFQELFEGS